MTDIRMRATIYKMNPEHLRMPRRSDMFKKKKNPTMMGCWFRTSGVPWVKSETGLNSQRV